MTFLELTVVTAKHLEEDRAQALRWHTDQQIKNALNDALSVYPSLTMCIESSVDIPATAGNPFYDLLGIEPKAIALLRLAENGARLAPDAIARFKAGNNSWRNSPGLPESFAVVGSNLLAVEPVPASSQVAINATVARSANALLFDSDVPEIPVEDHFCLAEYAAWFLETVKTGASETANQRLMRFLETVSDRIDQVRDRCKNRNYLTMPLPIDKETISKIIGGSSERRNRRL